MTGYDTMTKPLLFGVHGVAVLKGEEDNHSARTGTCLSFNVLMRMPHTPNLLFGWTWLRKA